MILVDSSIWIDHLRTANSRLIALLANNEILCHPYVVGEIALGSLRDRARFVAELLDLPRAEVASDLEVLDFIERHSLFGRGIGYIEIGRAHV